VLDHHRDAVPSYDADDLAQDTELLVGTDVVEDVHRGRDVELGVAVRKATGHDRIQRRRRTDVPAPSRLLDHAVRDVASDQLEIGRVPAHGAQELAGAAADVEEAAGRPDAAYEPVGLLIEERGGARAEQALQRIADAAIVSGRERVELRGMVVAGGQ